MYTQTGRIKLTSISCDCTYHLFLGGFFIVWNQKCEKIQKQVKPKSKPQKKDNPYDWDPATKHSLPSPNICWLQTNRVQLFIEWKSISPTSIYICRLNKWTQSIHSSCCAMCLDKLVDQFLVMVARVTEHTKEMTPPWQQTFWLAKRTHFTWNSWQLKFDSHTVFFRWFSAKNRTAIDSYLGPHSLWRVCMCVYACIVLLIFQFQFHVQFQIIRIFHNKSKNTICKPQFTFILAICNVIFCCCCKQWFGIAQ